MEPLHALLGREQEASQLFRELLFALQGLHAPVVGALHVTCADESEHETAEAFQRRFASQALPRLKYGSRVPMRIANAGARYEWGTVRVTEQHFATPASKDAFKVLVVLLLAHVSVDRTGRGLRFGTMERYGAPSVYCGALHGLLDGATFPLHRDLEEAFLSEGRDRLAVLRDERQVDPGLRPLLAAVTSARLQARRAVLDIQDYQPVTPTYYVVLHGVNLNKPGPDSLLFGGVYTLDRRDGGARDVYRGLGDDPAAYRVDGEGGRLRMADADLPEAREARDHRGLARQRLRTVTDAPPAHHPELDEVRHRVARPEHRHGEQARVLLRNAIRVLASLSPVSTALLLFAEGLADIHHAFRLHTAAPHEDREHNARVAIRDAAAKVDALAPERAAAVAEELLTAVSGR